MTSMKPSTEPCPFCGECNLFHYRLDGAIHEVQDPSGNGRWGRCQDIWDDELDAIDFNYVFCESCDNWFDPDTTRVLIQNPLECLARMAEHVTKALKEDMVPLPLRMVPKEVADAQIAANKKLAEREAMSGDPELLP